MTTGTAPKDTLDAAATAGVNGSEGDFFADWDSIDWDQAEKNVRHLRQRIFTASKDGDLARVRNLQKLMLRSLSNTLVSVRRVTEVNTGRKTAGFCSPIHRSRGPDAGQEPGCCDGSAACRTACDGRRPHDDGA